MISNAMGMTNFSYEMLRKKTVEDTEYYTQTPYGKAVMENIKYDFNKETFTMTLDGIEVNADMTLSFTGKKTNIYEVEITTVPFDYTFSAWTRLKEMADAGKNFIVDDGDSKTETPVQDIIDGGGTLNPYAFFDNTDVVADAEKTEYKNIFVVPTGKIDFANGKMTFAFPWYLENAYGCQRVEATYILVINRIKTSNANNMYKITKQTLLFVMLITFGLSAFANKDKAINLPRGTVEGYLDNGLHYIIMPNALPRHGIEMRLVMKVGSLQESDQQKGGAHFLEHMSFSGTTHFPQDAWVDYFERLGMKYGRDINAFTGFDRTIYWLSLPVADFGTQVMDSTLLAVRDILDGVAFDPQSVNQERGVIKEELRSYNTGDDFYNLKIGVGRYILRMPLGTEQDIESISRNELLNYYHQWYLPKNACLVIVGNVDAQDIQKRILATFNQVAKGQPTPLGNYPLIYKKGITFHEVKDTVGTSSKLEFIIPHEGVVANTIASTALKEQYRLLMAAIGKRMAAQGIRCDVNDAWYLANQNHFSFR